MLDVVKRIVDGVIEAPYAETKAQNRLIDEYIEASALKFKRVIQKN